MGYHAEPLSLEHPEGLAQKTINNNATSTENNRTAWWPGTMKLEALTRCVVPNWSQMMPSSPWPIFYWFEWQVTSIASWVNLLFTKQKQEITYCDSFSIISVFWNHNFFFVWGVTHLSERTFDHKHQPHWIPPKNCCFYFNSHLHVCGISCLIKYSLLYLIHNKQHNKFYSASTVTSYPALPQPSLREIWKSRFGTQFSLLDMTGLGKLNSTAALLESRQLLQSL